MDVSRILQLMDHLQDLINPTADHPTPFVVVDAEVARRNIAEQQSACNQANVRLRPHIKTHKSAELARWQLDAGAVGVTVATLSEALALGEAGVRCDVFLSTPVFLDIPKLGLLEQVVAATGRLSVAVDSLTILHRVLELAPAQVDVMVEVDSGLDRTGLPPREAILLGEMAGDRLAGYFTHGGHGYAPGAAIQAGSDEHASLASVAVGDAAIGLVMSAGSTPTRSTATGPPINEIRPGTYIFGDHQQVVLGAMRPMDVAAGIITTVIHRSGDKVVIDAGAKSLSKDRAGFLSSFGAVVGYPDITIETLNDNHGVGRTGSVAPRVGERVVVVPNHICPVINLFDVLVMASDSEVQLLPVDLRGRQA